MADTLVKALQSVDSISDRVNVDKQALQAELLNEARRNHPLVDGAVKGNFSFQDIVDIMYQKYAGWKLLLPTLRDEEYDKKIDELHLDKLIDSSYAFKTDKSQTFSAQNQYTGRFLGWFYDKIANPIALPLLTGAFMALLGGGKGPFESEVANYTAQFGAGAVAGSFVGLFAISLKMQQLSFPRSQAEYLDRKIQALRPYLN